MLTEVNRLITDKSDQIAGFLELFVIPNAKAGEELKRAWAEGLGKPGATKTYFGEHVEHSRKTIMAHLKELDAGIKAVNEKAFDRPLSEKNAKLKFLWIRSPEDSGIVLS